jgi:hypothetical protein
MCLRGTVLTLILKSGWDFMSINMPQILVYTIPPTLKDKV